MEGAVGAGSFGYVQKSGGGRADYGDGGRRVRLGTADVAGRNGHPVRRSENVRTRCEDEIVICMYTQDYLVEREAALKTEATKS